MKRIIALFLALIMTIPLLAGCGSEQEEALSGKKNTEAVKHDPAKVTKGEAVEDVAVNYNGKESVIIGSIDNNKFVLSLESGSFPEGSKVSAKPLDDDQLKSAVICGKFEQIIAPVDLSVDGYDGSYFGGEWEASDYESDRFKIYIEKEGNGISVYILDHGTDYSCSPAYKFIDGSLVFDDDFMYDGRLTFTLLDANTIKMTGAAGNRTLIKKTEQD